MIDLLLFRVSILDILIAMIAYWGFKRFVIMIKRGVEYKVLDEETGLVLRAIALGESKSTGKASTSRQKSLGQSSVTPPSPRGATLAGGKYNDN